jgi:hypothetical protein
LRVVQTHIDAQDQRIRELENQAAHSAAAPSTCGWLPIG